MGNDGGSIPTRRELVKTSARAPTHSELRSSTAATQTYRWTTCQLSKRPLSSPVVSDAAGQLYNKDSILEWLLKKTEAFGDGEDILQGRVTGLKDVVEVKFTEGDKRDKKERGEGETGWICPVTRKELGPGAKSVYLVPCGHAFAESAVKELGAEERVCLTCNTPYEERNIIPINSTDQKDLDRLQDRINTLKATENLTHSLKKAASEKKSKKRKADKEGGAEGGGKKKKEEGDKTDGGIQNADTARMVAKVLGDEKEKSAGRKKEMSENLKSLFTKKEEITGRNTDFMSRGYSIPKN